MKEKDTDNACVLHAHLAYIYKDDKAREGSLTKKHVTTLLISQIFLTSRFSFGTNPAGKNANVLSLGIPQSEIFEVFQRQRHAILAWLQDHPEKKNLVMEAVVRVVTLTGTRLQSYGETEEDRGEESARKWLELELPECAGRFVPDTEASMLELAPLEGESYEEWLRRSTSQTADTEVNLQFGEFTLKKHKVEVLDTSIRRIADFVDVFGASTANIASAEVKNTTNRKWLRLVGRRHDVQLWRADPTLSCCKLPRERKYSRKSLSAEEAWIADILEPCRLKHFPDANLYMRKKPYGAAAPLAVLYFTSSSTMSTDTHSTADTMDGDDEQTQTAKEIIVLRHHRGICVYNVVEHGRRYMKRLVYASNARASLASGLYKLAFTQGQPCLECGDPMATQRASPSLIITRSLSAELGLQEFVPKRFLQGLIPSALVELYDFWRNEDGTMTGYMTSNPSAEGKGYQGAPRQRMASQNICHCTGANDATGNCNSTAVATSQGSQLPMRQRKRAVRGKRYLSICADALLHSKIIQDDDGARGAKTRKGKAARGLGRSMRAKARKVADVLGGSIPSLTSVS